MCCIQGNIRKSLWIVLFLGKTLGGLRAALLSQPGRPTHPVSESQHPERNQGSFVFSDTQLGRPETVQGENPTGDRQSSLTSVWSSSQVWPQQLAVWDRARVCVLGRCALTHSGWEANGPDFAKGHFVPRTQNLEMYLFLPQWLWCFSPAWASTFPQGTLGTKLLSSKNSSVWCWEEYWNWAHSRHLLPPFWFHVGRIWQALWWQFLDFLTCTWSSTCTLERVYIVINE